MIIHDITQTEVPTESLRFGSWYKVKNKEGEIGFAIPTCAKCITMMAFFKGKEPFVCKSNNPDNSFKSQFDILEEVNAEITFTSLKD